MLHNMYLLVPRDISQQETFKFDVTQLIVSLILDRPEQPYWEYTMWKCLAFSATQILREINFGHFEDLKNCHFDILSSSEF